MIKISQLIIF